MIRACWFRFGLHGCRLSLRCVWCETWDTALEVVTRWPYREQAMWSSTGPRCTKIFIAPADRRSPLQEKAKFCLFGGCYRVLHARPTCCFEVTFDLLTRPKDARLRPSFVDSWKMKYIWTCEFRHQRSMFFPVSQTARWILIMCFNAATCDEGSSRCFEVQKIKALKGWWTEGCRCPSFVSKGSFVNALLKSLRSVTTGFSLLCGYMSSMRPSCAKGTKGLCKRCKRCRQMAIAMFPKKPPSTRCGCFFGFCADLGVESLEHEPSENAVGRTSWDCRLFFFRGIFLAGASSRWRAWRFSDSTLAQKISVSISKRRQRKASNPEFLSEA